MAMAALLVVAAAATEDEVWLESEFESVEVVMARVVVAEDEAVVVVLMELAFLLPQ